MQQNRQTAVVLFTRNASEEASVKDFAEHFRANELIAGKLISHTLHIIKKSGLPCFIIDSAHQHGNNFGERFTDAIEQVFAAGFENALVVGNDCPHLHPADLQTAAKKLETVNYVIGPSSDGGFYLFGVQKQFFNKEFLLEAPWESEGLFDFIIESLHTNNISAYLTEKKDDIDSANDLYKILSIQSNSFTQLIIYIRSVLSSFFKAYRPRFLNQSWLFLISSSLRAPPVYNY